MKRYPCLLLLLCLTAVCFGQEKFQTHPETLIISNDSITLRWGNIGVDKYWLRGDSMNYNSGAVPGAFFVLFYKNDSVRVEYNNKIPYGQYTYFNLTNNQKKWTIRLGFDPQPAIFSKKYIQENTGKVQFDIPEVYELANVIWTLSPGGKRATDLNKGNSYHAKVLSYFAPYMDHPVFSALDLPDSLYLNSYYDFRENSFAYNFKATAPGSASTELLYNGPYYSVYGGQYADSSLFGKLKPLVEDFAKRSKFRSFYKRHTALYHQQIRRAKELLPVKQMWAWLEEQFPATQYQSYRIVFSPLIGNSHSTQNYSYNDGKLFSQSVMFICNTDRVDTVKQMTEQQREGVMSGVVFTEIDHNYVNRASSKYGKQIDSIFSNRAVWAKQGNSSSFYGSPRSVFNEYMTWSVFCLYVLDKY
ncbi:MAG: DUF4932 domain-containing protein, partial [Chitinophagaceae bacterium]|nr:DUF4932 domain-containing protein [Chitinophagaceae bacterium]